MSCCFDISKCRIGLNSLCITEMFIGKESGYSRRDCSKLLQAKFNIKGYGYWPSKYFVSKVWNCLLSCVKNVSDICNWCLTDQGWGLLSQFPPFRYFPIFSALSNHTLAIAYHVYIWQVAPQPSCGDTCQIWMWFEESNMCFSQVENFAYGEINERSFSNSHHRTGRCLYN